MNYEITIYKYKLNFYSNIYKTLINQIIKLYAMKTVLITGGTGFIGSHLCEFFLKKNKKIICFDLKKKKKIHWIKNASKNLKIVLGDVNNKELINNLIKKSDYVIHLAAEISIPHSYQNTQIFCDTNIYGTFNILEAVKKYNIPLIVTSTSETYGSGLKFPMNETHRLFSQSPYAATKNAADQLSLSYYNSFGLRVKIIRPFNCFGPRQSMRAIIPNMVVQMLKGKKKIKVGNIETIRDFTYVEDLCDAFWLLYKKKRGYGEIFNVCNGKGVKIVKLFKILQKKINSNCELSIEKKRLRPIKSEVKKLIGDNSKISKEYGWKPGQFIKNLNKTVDWYSENLDRFENNNYEI